MMAEDQEQKFAEAGLKMLISVGGFALGGVPTVAGAIGFASGVIGFLTSSNTASAVDRLKQEVVSLQAGMTTLRERFDELVVEDAAEANRNVWGRLNDRLDDIKRLGLRFGDSPGDVDTAVDVANELGVVVDAFLRGDFDLWRWADVVEKNGHPDMERLRFKNVPTLPVYLAGLLNWLAARQVVVDANQRHRLNDDAPRVLRHLQAVSVRDEFDKYADGSASVPTSITEHIRWRIRAWVISLNRQPEDQVCRFNFEVRDWMTVRRTRADDFLIVTRSNDVLCTIDPASLGAPNTELQWETDAGVDVLHEMAVTLDRVARTGSMREQLIGVFPSTVAYPPTRLYVIAQNGDLHWYRNVSASKPGGSTSWNGPQVIGTGFQGFSTVFNGGDSAIYGIKPDGTMLWYGHDGFNDGSPVWRSPKQVGMGWQSFTSVFPGGEFTIYGIHADGRLWWYRHHGARYGGEAAADWSGPIEVATGWGGFVHVFAAGEGVIYALDAEGNLYRTTHRGYQTGSTNWAPLELIATGWNTFFKVAAGVDGVIYGFKRDGRVFFTRYAVPRPPGSDDRPGAAGEPPPPRAVTVGSWGLSLLLAITPVWEGPPIEIKKDMPAFRAAFPVMDAPPAPGSVLH